MTTYTTHSYGTFSVRQRNSDGYLSATDMCKIYGKTFAQYKKSSTTKAYLSAVEAIFGKSLVQTKSGGGLDRGAWVHPYVAVYLSRLLNMSLVPAAVGWANPYLPAHMQTPVQMCA